MRDEPTVSAMAARAVVHAACGRGASLPALCGKVGLDPASLADIDARVGVSTMVALWDEVEKLDPDFGLHLGEVAVSTQYALPWHLLHGSATLGEGIERLAAAWRIFNDIHPPEIVLPPPSEGKDGWIRIATKGSPYPVPRQAIEYAFSWFVSAGRRVTATDFRPKWIAFETPRPTSTEEHDRIYGCPIAWDAEAATIVFTAESLACPTTTGGDPNLVELLGRHVEALLAKLPPPVTGQEYSTKVRAALMPLLPHGAVTIDRIASEVGTSTRSIQRYLREEGTTFQRVLDALRKDVALTYLEDRTRSLAEVALMLGFSDQSTFHRAFVRWTGRTPGDVRRAARSAAGLAATPAMRVEEAARESADRAGRGEPARNEYEVQRERQGAEDTKGDDHGP